MENLLKSNLTFELYQPKEIEVEIQFEFKYDSRIRTVFLDTKTFAETHDNLFKLMEYYKKYREPFYNMYKGTIKEQEEKDDFASLFLALSDDYDLEDTDEYVSIKNILIHLDSGVTVKVKEENYNDLQA